MNETTDTTEAHALAVFVEGGYDRDRLRGRLRRNVGARRWRARTAPIIVAYVRVAGRRTWLVRCMEAAGLNAGWLDVEQIAFDMECGGDVWSADAEPGYVHVFRSV